MSFEVQTKLVFNSEKTGSWERDTSLRLLPALHVIPFSGPSMCSMNIGLFSFCAIDCAFESDVYQGMSIVSFLTLSSASSPETMDMGAALLSCGAAVLRIEMASMPATPASLQIPFIKIPLVGFVA